MLDSSYGILTGFNESVSSGGINIQSFLKRKNDNYVMGFERQRQACFNLITFHKAEQLN